MRMQIYFSDEESDFVKSKEPGYVRGLVKKAMEPTKVLEFNVPKSEMREYKEPIWKDKKKKTL